MTLLYKLPHFGGGMQMHDYRPVVNIHNMAAECNHILNRDTPKTLITSKNAIFKYNRHFQVEHDDIHLMNSKPINRVLNDYADIVTKVKQIEQGDKIEILLQRRYAKSFISSQAPASFRFQDEHDHAAIFCIQQYNVADSMYEFKDTSEVIKKDISPGLMIILHDPQRVLITPSRVKVQDHYDDHAYEDVMILTYMRNKKINNK